MNETDNRVRDLLDALGDTPDAVAATLAAKGIKGRRSCADGCPVANYLTANGMHVFGVDRFSIDLTTGRIEVPAPVGAFIARFDIDGLWPELVSGGAS